MTPPSQYITVKAAVIHVLWHHPLGGSFLPLPFVATFKVDYVTYALLRGYTALHSFFLPQELVDQGPF